MTNKQVENRVRNAFSGSVPNDFEKILLKCHEEAPQKILQMPARKRNWVKQVLSVAAVVLLIFTSGLAGYNIAKIEKVDSIISFDVNPSIEIKIDKNEKIVDATANNADGEKILGEMNLKGSDLSVAVNAIIGSMLRNGYLDELSNAILISVDSPDAQRGEHLEKRLMEEISMLLSGESFDAAVISQMVNRSKEIEELAREYGITLGKAQLIKQITDADKNYSFKDLAPLTINELSLLASGEKVNINTSGSASEKRYIGKTRAKKAALKDDGVKEEEIFDYSCSLKYKNGRMVYEIAFKNDNAAYNYLINATSGKIVKADIERASQTRPQDGVADLLDEAAVKAAALSLAGASEADISEYVCTLNDSAKIPYYSMSFIVGETSYSYNINAATGELMTISTEEPDDATASQPDTSEEDSTLPDGSENANENLVETPATTP